LGLTLGVNAYRVPHREGDELAYLAVARAMGWDGSNYTTRDHPVVSQFPYSIYQGPLFHQPPLYPYVLKVGDRLGMASQLGLAAQTLTLFLALGAVVACRRSLGLRLREVGCCLLLLVSCPVLNRSRTLLHVDALAGFLGLAGYCCFLSGVQRRSLPRCLAAGGLLGLSLNARYSSIALLPLLALPLVLSLLQEAGSLSARLSRAWSRQGRFFLAAAGLAAVLGAPHYVRVWVTYGGLTPSHFLVAYPELFNAHLTKVHGRNRVQVLAYLLCAAPCWIVLLSPSYWRLCLEQIRRRAPLASAFLAFPYLLATVLVFQHFQLRYFALALPFCYLVVPRVLERMPRWYRALWLVLAVAIMLGTSWYMLYEFPQNPCVRPVFLKIWPLLQRYYV
jgi:hypothetical protein